MTLYLFKGYLQTFLSKPIIQKCQILNCDILVANEFYIYIYRERERERERERQTDGQKQRQIENNATASNKLFSTLLYSLLAKFVPFRFHPT